MVIRKITHSPRTSNLRRSTSKESTLEAWKVGVHWEGVRTKAWEGASTAGPSAHGGSPSGPTHLSEAPGSQKWSVLQEGVRWNVTGKKLACETERCLKHENESPWGCVVSRSAFILSFNTLWPLPSCCPQTETSRLCRKLSFLLPRWSVLVFTFQSRVQLLG